MDGMRANRMTSETAKKKCRRIYVGLRNDGTNVSVRVVGGGNMRMLARGG
jgi:hypothetical protein